MCVGIGWLVLILPSVAIVAAVIGYKYREHVEATENTAG